MVPITVSRLCHPTSQFGHERTSAVKQPRLPGFIPIEHIWRRRLRPRQGYTLAPRSDVGDHLVDILPKFRSEVGCRCTGSPHPYHPVLIPKGRVHPGILPSPKVSIQVTVAPLIVGQFGNSQISGEPTVQYAPFWYSKVVKICASACPDNEFGNLLRCSGPPF